jgi:hypothetical protein
VTPAKVPECLTSKCRLENSQGHRGKSRIEHLFSGMPPRAAGSACHAGTYVRPQIRTRTGVVSQGILF